MSSAPKHDQEQMAFEDVCEMERVHGDREYTEWLAAGKPVLDADDTPRNSQVRVNVDPGR